MENERLGRSVILKDISPRIDYHNKERLRLV